MATVDLKNGYLSKTRYCLAMRMECSLVNSDIHGIPQVDILDGKIMFTSSVRSFPRGPLNIFHPLSSHRLIYPQNFISVVMPLTVGRKLTARFSYPDGFVEELMFEVPISKHSQKINVISSTVTAEPKYVAETATEFVAEEIVDSTTAYEIDGGVVPIIDYSVIMEKKRKLNGEFEVCR